MRVVVLENPAAGRGRGGEVAERIARALERRGWKVDRGSTPRMGDDAKVVEAALAGSGAVIVAGGDGSCRRVARGAIPAGVPLYHAPCGTENLLAGQFGMVAEGEAVLRAVEAMRVTEVDAGMCEGEVFLLMCGIGPDGGIVRRLSRAREGPIRRWSYVRHVLEEARAGELPALTIRSEGRLIVDGRRGAVVIANSRGYALGIDPAPGASMRDGMLDLVFFPARVALVGLLWAVWSRARLNGTTLARRMGVVTAVGRGFEVETGEAEARAQIDGDPFASGAGGAGGMMRVSVMARRLRLLLPCGR